MGSVGGMGIAVRGVGGVRTMGVAVRGVRIMGVVIGMTLRRGV